MARRWNASELRILATDRRKSAVHEAGHYVVARWAGVRQVGAWIGRSKETDLTCNRSWTGQIVWNSGRLESISDRRRMMIAVAGAFATVVWEHHFDPDDTLYLEYPGIALGDPFFMSPSDWRLADHDPGDCSRRLERAAESVVELLQGELWQPLLAASRSLIRNGILLPDKPPAALRQSVEQKLRLAA